MMLATAAPVTPSILVVFILIFARITAGIGAAPIFSEKSIPSQVKVGLSAIIAGILTPEQLALVHADALPTDPATLTFLVAQQVLLGLAFALVFTAIFKAGEAAGELIGQQLGVTLASAVRSETEMHTIGQLYNIIAALIFLGLDGQHWVILGLGTSLETMPITRVVLSPALLDTLMALGGASLQFTAGLAFPLIVTLLLADIITGLLGRAMPALNMFVLGLPLKMALGLIGLLIVAPFTVSMFLQDFQYLPRISLWH